MGEELASGVALENKLTPVVPCEPIWLSAAAEQGILLITDSVEYHFSLSGREASDECLLLRPGTVARSSYRPGSFDIEHDKNLDGNGFLFHGALKYRRAGAVASLAGAVEGGDLVVTCTSMAGDELGVVKMNVETATAAELRSRLDCECGTSNFRLLLP